jgi:hypothetical protein
MCVVLIIGMSVCVIEIRKEVDNQVQLSVISHSDKEEVKFGDQASAFFHQDCIRLVKIVIYIIHHVL